MQPQSYIISRAEQLMQQERYMYREQLMQPLKLHNISRAEQFMKQDILRAVDATRKIYVSRAVDATTKLQYIESRAEELMQQ